jgi:hypothetical protein
MGEQGLESHPNDSNLAQNPGENWAIKESLVIAFYYAILNQKFPYDRRNNKICLL